MKEKQLNDNSLASIKRVINPLITIYNNLYFVIDIVYVTDNISLSFFY